MELRALDAQETRWLYEQKMLRDFPRSELKQLSAILRLMDGAVYDVFGAYEGEEMAAYALIFRPRGSRVMLLDYLAVEPHLRSHGVGAVLLKLLRAHYAHSADALFIECERPKAAPDEAMARRRIRFYERSGAKMTPVRIALFGVAYSILVLPCAENVDVQQDWAQQMLFVYRQMLPPHLFERSVQLIRA